MKTGALDHFFTQLIKTVPTVLMEPEEEDIARYLIDRHAFLPEDQIAIEIHLHRVASRTVLTGVVNRIDGNNVYVSLWDSEKKKVYDSACQKELFFNNGIEDVEEGMHFEYEMLKYKNLSQTRAKRIEVEPSEQELQESISQLKEEDIYDF